MSMYSSITTPVAAGAGIALDAMGEGGAAAPGAAVSADDVVKGAQDMAGVDCRVVEEDGLQSVECEMAPDADGDGARTS